MADAENKAREYVVKAEKKLKSFGFFGNKYEDAADLLEKAGNQFKLAKNWVEAGNAFLKLAEVQAKLESKHDSATAFVEASKCYMKVNAKDAIKCLNCAVEIYSDMGRLGMAARNLKEIAELLEKQGKKEDCMQAYLQAADLFSGEESTAEANKCRLKVAQFSAELEQYGQAVEIYEDVARASAENNLLKYSAKGYLLNAGICQLCLGDMVSVRNAIEKYKDIDISFGGNRECKLLEDLAEAVEAGDVEKFQDHLAEFDSLTRLDPWKTSLLLRVKKKVESGAFAEADDWT